MFLSRSGLEINEIWAKQSEAIREAAAPESYDDLIASGHSPALARSLIKRQEAVKRARERAKAQQAAQTPEEREKERERAAQRSQLAGRLSAGERRANEKQRAGNPWLTASVLANSGFLSESDTHLRKLEKRWSASDSPEDAKLWAHAALRAGHHPLEVGKRLHAANPKAHEEMAEELWKSHPGASHKEVQRHRREVHGPFNLPAHLHRYVKAVNDHDDHVAGVQRAHREDPNHKHDHSKVEHGERKKFQALRELHASVRQIHGKADKDDDHHSRVLNYLMKHHEHDDKSKLRTLADYHAARHQDSEDIHDVREGEGAKPHVHHVDVNAYNRNYPDTRNLETRIEEYLPHAKVTRAHMRHRRHYHGTTPYLRVEFPEKKSQES